ncbi:hypothetical protein AVEN_105548-1 [Araneus ventricosus]|uniref:Uncharacterized protein n=1 Tax=Araneus ventricosus TaxID=182803 RepID=A0A4Y2GSC8_ARAVE|nr:hypothetical protein AVEN_105548-1 [Araneus ventricosus]
MGEHPNGMLLICLHHELKFPSHALSLSVRVLNRKRNYFEKRTFASQFEIMLDYFEKYPQILSGKVDRIFSKDTKVCPTKSEFSQGLLHPRHTALFGPPGSETSNQDSRIRFLPPCLPSNSVLFTLKWVRGGSPYVHLPFPTLDNGTLVDQQLTFLVVNPDYGKVLEFSPPPAYSGMTPKGTANVFADSDGFLGIVATLCVKPFLCARLVRMSRCNCPAVYRQYEKGRHSFSHGNCARGKETLQNSSSDWSNGLHYKGYPDKLFQNTINVLEASILNENLITSDIETTLLDSETNLRQVVQPSPITSIEVCIYNMKEVRRPRTLGNVPKEIQTRRSVIDFTPAARAFFVRVPRPEGFGEQGRGFPEFGECQLSVMFLRGEANFPYL